MQSEGGSVLNSYSFILEIESANPIAYDSSIDRTPPDLLIEDIDKQGNVRIMFSKLMEVPDDISIINEDIFDI